MKLQQTIDLNGTYVVENGNESGGIEYIALMQVIGNEVFMSEWHLYGTYSVEESIKQLKKVEIKEGENITERLGVIKIIKI